MPVNMGDIDDTLQGTDADLATQPGKDGKKPSKPPIGSGYGPDIPEKRTIVPEHGPQGTAETLVWKGAAEKSATKPVNRTALMEKRALWKDKLQKVYSSFEEFEAYSEIYNLAARLGFSSAEEAWQANPTVQGSVDPADYKTVPPKGKKMMGSDKNTLRESLREKIAARRAERQTEQSQKWARLRQVATEEPKEVDEALNEVAEALGTMSEALTNLRENLDLVKAPKEASLKVRIASARKYASAFKQVASDTPEVIVDAVAEIYNSLDEIAAGLENLADNLGFEIPESPAMEEVAEEGHEEIAEAKAEGESVGEEIEEEAEEMTEEIEGEGEGEEESKEASGADNFIMDNSDKGVEHMDIPEVKVK